MKRLLVIRFSALGDVALLVPVVRATAVEHPELEITVLSQSRMAYLFAGMPANVQFMGVDLQKMSLQDIVKALGAYDFVADMHGVWRSWYIDLRMWLLGAKVRKRHGDPGKLRQDHRPGPGPHRKKAPAALSPRQSDPLGGELRLQPALPLLPELRDFAGGGSAAAIPPRRQ